MQNIGFWSNAWNKLVYGWDLTEIGKSLLVVPDFSHWSVDSANPKIDEEKFAKQIEDKGVTTLIYKGTDSWNGNLFTDKTASFWWGVGEKFGLARGCYHWLQPGVDPTVAFNYHKNHLDSYPTELPYIMDFEEKKITSASDYLWRAYTWLGLADADRGDKTLVYSAPWYIDFLKTMLPSLDWEKKMGMLRAWPLWAAFYSRYMPKNLWPWTDFVGWQYSDAADFPYYKDDDQYWGDEWGIPSKGLDMSLFREEWITQYLVSEPVEPDPDPEPDPEPEPVVGLSFTTLFDMNIRTGPGTNYGRDGIMEKGTVIEPLDFDGTNSWVKTDRGWVCKRLNTTTYLEKED